MSKFLIIHQKDNVGVAMEPLQKGDNVAGIVLSENIPLGHKFSLKKIDKNQDVIKYGMPIGHATVDINVGEHVHVQNVKTNLKDDLEYTYNPELNSCNFANLPERTINAYVRKDGKVGIRNFVTIVPTVGCVNGICQSIAAAFKAETDGKYYDEVLVLGHPYGCSQLGGDHNHTKASLQHLVVHPNNGAVLVVGLGCENNQMKPFMDTLPDYDANRVRFMVAQDVHDEVAEGVRLLKEVYENMKQDQRVPVSLSKLNIGLKCGGSDGLSGITANPLLGKFSDYHGAHGGTTVLTEVPEMFGAETLLMSRADNKETFNKTVKLINDFKDYYRKNDQVIYENPSPGNKNGGITTLEDKSLGCVQKGGCGIVTDVLDMHDMINKPGLNLMKGPGNDLVATSLLGMSGCQMVLFTTGRGTPFGGFIPTMKISSNSPLFNNKPNWIDFNAGMVADGVSFDDALIKFIDLICEVASGKLVKHEENHNYEIAIFKFGVTL